MKSRSIIILVLLISVAATVLQVNRVSDRSLDSKLVNNSLIFQHTIIDPAPPSGNGCCLDILAIGDLDSDKKADIMVASQESIGAVWYQYPDWQHYPISDGEFTTDGEIADIDGDGDGDVILSDYRSDAIAWWENTNDPFQAEGWIRHQIGTRFAHDLAVKDINGDGKLDVAMFRKDRPRQLTWFAAPQDHTQPWIRHQIDTPPGEGLDLGDLDGDGDIDIAASHYWYENRDSLGLKWRKHQVTAKWGQDTRAIIADLNDDGKQDIVLSHSEGAGRVSWFANPTWTEGVIELNSLQGCHSLEVGDFDYDGDLDVFAGEMNTGGKGVMVYENLGKGDLWKPMVLSKQGTHNARVGDVGSDGSLDIVGKNYTGKKVVELWSNLSTKPRLTLDDWIYIRVDDKRKTFNQEVRFFGLATGDLTGDGFPDIVSGRYFYRNPGGDLTDNWERVTFPLNVDAMLIVDVDDDEFGDAIAEALPNIYWLEAQDSQGSSWSITKVATMPATSHVNGQGYQLAQIVPGGKPEILLAGGNEDREIYYFEISDDPTAGNWQPTLITNEATDEGIGDGDIDRDGDIDIAVGDMYTGVKKVSWWENPGNNEGNWIKHKIGRISQWPDRFSLVDLNNDGRLDLVVSEESESEKPNAHVYWFEQPEQLQFSWLRHLVATQYTTNSMNAADLDGDGEVDIVTGEHRGDKQVAIWKNINRGSSWMKYLVAENKESHLGTKLADLDNDGDLEIISIAWDDYPLLHLWRNDAKRLTDKPVNDNFKHL
ncbi:VCBS repeat-containing protein [Myxosarcina sp. GI1]|uniref:FG-GAP repeat domain-containing protein n=1 Tax=Myxosarcina sp. GI1 TaxID=1541065 RepID=UPI0009DD5D8C|nr:VCBS repeat-containing protein [Myxosarcina sp. GI1]